MWNGKCDYCKHLNDSNGFCKKNKSVICFQMVHQCDGPYKKTKVKSNKKGNIN